MNWVTWHDKVSHIWVGSVIISLVSLIIGPGSNLSHVFWIVMSGKKQCQEQSLNSCWPFSRHTAHLVANNYDLPKAWNDHIKAGPPLIRSACPPPSPSLPPGADLTRKQWVPHKLLHSGTARVGETLQRWGMQEAASCPCGHPTQTVEHVVSDRILLESPGDLTALHCPNAETRSWHSEMAIELWFLTIWFFNIIAVWQTLIYRWWC